MKELIDFLKQLTGRETLTPADIISEDDKYYSFVPKEFLAINVLDEKIRDNDEVTASLDDAQEVVLEFLEDLAPDELVILFKKYLDVDITIDDSNKLIEMITEELDKWIYFIIT